MNKAEEVKMLNYKMFLLAGFILILTSLAFAEGQAASEAVNYYNEGVNCQKTGDFEKAIIAYNKTLTMDPSYTKWILNNYGVMYVRQGDFRAAGVAFKEALGLDPNYKQAEINLALLYEKMGQRLKALDYWEKIFNLNAMKPNDFALEEEKDKRGRTVKDQRDSYLGILP